MIRRVCIAVLSFVLIGFFGKPLATPATAMIGGAQQSTTPRLVVFESFLDPEWSICVAAGPAIDSLAGWYTAHSLPVVFLEMNENQMIGRRYSRFYAAFTAGGSTDNTKPWVMVDSGHLISNGWVNFDHVYKDMVDAELARPAQAEVSVFAQREGNHIKAEVNVTNLSGVDLSYASNKATVHVVIYEDTDVGLTNRYDRAAPSQTITTTLPNGASATYTIESVDLTGVDWNKLHAVAMVDYMPGGTTGAYDMLQAAIGPVVAFNVQPENLNFLIDSIAPIDQNATINVSGMPSTLNWTASENMDWLTLVPASGSVGTSTQVHIDSDMIAEGTYMNGTITFQTEVSGKTLQRIVPVHVSKSEVFRMYLPLVELSNP